MSNNLTPEYYLEQLLWRLTELRDAEARKSETYRPIQNPDCQSLADVGDVTSRACAEALTDIYDAKQDGKSEAEVIRDAILNHNRRLRTITDEDIYHPLDISSAYSFVAASMRRYLRAIEKVTGQETKWEF